jgi:N12 class adenine-specific DNA methylase
MTASLDAAAIGIPTTEHGPTGLITKRQRLKDVYERFTNNLGLLNAPANWEIIRGDLLHGTSILALEQVRTTQVVSRDGKHTRTVVEFDRLSDIFEKNIFNVVLPPEDGSLESPADALGWSLNETGGVNLDYITTKLSFDYTFQHSEADIIETLGDKIFLDPQTERWLPHDEYLSGDVVSKLAEAREGYNSSPRYRRNVIALEQVQPTPLIPDVNDTGEGFKVQLGAPFVPPR